MKSIRLLTIGAYGWQESDFYRVLTAEAVDLFVDVRQRRGLRGPRYAWANARRLTAGVLDRGIDYRHVKDLAPDSETRRLQAASDEGQGVTKSQRSGLASTFVAEYQRRTLAQFDFDAFIQELSTYNAAVFFCVEGPPDACHRSLIARRLADITASRIQHLTP
jgi:hypothetical protein